jgi:thiol-disulfide isomerase/thioredoxin
MSTPAVVRKKIAILGKPYVKEVIYDAMEYYLSEVCGHPEQEGLAEKVEQIAKELENQYKQQLPKKQPKVKHYDLEDMVRDIRQLEKEQLEKAFKKQTNEHRDKETNSECGS